MPEHNDGDGWQVWGKHVLAELERQDKQLQDINTKVSRVETLLNAELSKVSVEIGMLKVKSGMWGAASGLLTALTVFLVSKA